MRADKEEIRARNDILDVIGRVVTLRKRGRNWQGLCPFHQEKTASFHVDPGTQSFKCFGCGASGDIFTFIERFENMTFVEAAEFLARRVGLTFEREGAPGRPAGGISERERIFRINAEAAAFFRTQLEKSDVARAYVERRGLAQETLDRFHIGYAPDRWDALAGFLHVRGHDVRLAATAGLVGSGRDGQNYDVFRGRLIFPIHDEQERVVGFGGRALGDEQPKYLNTGETPVFAKSRLLYGLPFARRRIGDEGVALLMEGYMDVVAVHQAGFTHAVATLGTSLTEDHARKLARLFAANPTVTLVYDGDAAGVKATLRASEMLEKEGIEVRVVALPQGDDPDSMVRSGRGDTFAQLVDAAPGRVTYQLDRLAAAADRTTDAGRARLLRQIVAILASIPSRSERDPYIERVWAYHPLGASGPAVAKEQLHRDAETYASAQRAANPPDASRRQSAPAAAEPAPRPTAPPAGQRSPFSTGDRRDGSRPGSWQGQRKPAVPPAGDTDRPIATGGRTSADRAEREVMRALCEPEWAGRVLDRTEPDDLVSPLARRLYELVRDNRAALMGGQEDVLAIAARTGDDSFLADVRDVVQDSRMGPTNAPLSEELVLDCLARLRRWRIARVKDDLARLIRSKPVLTDDDRESVRRHQELLSQLQAGAGD